jgi:hypothetical protein
MLTARFFSGNALTDFFLADVGISQNQFNVGQQLLSAGIVLLEVCNALIPSPLAIHFLNRVFFQIPSNLVLYRIGPTVWIGSQIIAWYRGFYPLALLVGT